MPSRAIVIGIDAYPHGIKSLTSCVTDAYRIGKWLVAGRGFAPGEIALGIAAGPASPGLPAALDGARQFLPDADNVDSELTDLLAAGPLDELVFFFAGHGASSANVAFADVDALCCADFTLQKARNALSVASIARVLKGVDADRRFLLIDACRDPGIQPNQRIGETTAMPPLSRRSPGLRVLHATAPGATAAGIPVSGGLMTNAFIDSVVEARGPAKQWDSTQGDYVVRWSKLRSAVAEQVLRTQNQLVFANDDLPAGSDIEIARFGASKVPKVSVTFAVQPPSPASGLLIRIRRDGTFDPEIQRKKPGSVQLEQSTYTIKATVHGQACNPKLIPAFPAFDGLPLNVVFELPVVPAASSPPPPPPSSGAKASVSFDPGDSDGGDPTAPTANALPAGVGLLEVTSDGKPIAPDDPLLSISLATPAGERIDWDRATPYEQLEKGAYTVELTGASGAVRTADVYVEPGATTKVDLPPVFNPAPALETALAELSTSNPLMPSELLGPLSDLTMAGLGSLGVAQNVLGRTFAPAARLQLGDQWVGSAEAGVHLLITDERLETGSAQELHVWQMNASDAHLTAKTSGAADGLGFAQAAVMVPPGGYWIALANAQAIVPATFKAATFVLLQHVTLLVAAREASGQTRFFQFAIDPNGEAKAVLRSVVFGEALQRARLDGRPIADDASFQALLRDEWFEPVSALVAAFTLYEAGDAFEEMFRTLVDTLERRDTRLPDLGVARALRHELDGDKKAARSEYARLIDTCHVPTTSAATIYLRDAALRYGLKGAGRRFLEDKTHKMFAHPLWTIIE